MFSCEYPPKVRTLWPLGHIVCVFMGLFCSKPCLCNSLILCLLVVCSFANQRSCIIFCRMGYTTITEAECKLLWFQVSLPISVLKRELYNILLVWREPCPLLLCSLFWGWKGQDFQFLYLATLYLSPSEEALIVSSFFPGAVYQGSGYWRRPLARWALLWSLCGAPDWSGRLEREELEEILGGALDCRNAVVLGLHQV